MGILYIERAREGKTAEEMCNDIRQISVIKNTYEQLTCGRIAIFFLSIFFQRLKLGINILVHFLFCLLPPPNIPFSSFRSLYSRCLDIKRCSPLLYLVSFSLDDDSDEGATERGSKKKNISCHTEIGDGLKLECTIRMPAIWPLATFQRYEKTTNAYGRRSSVKRSSKQYFY